MLNNVSIVGRLVKETDIVVVGKDSEKSMFTLACQRDYKNNNDEYVTDFIDCEVWGSGAEFITRYGKKGDLISVSGRLQKDTWKDKDNNTKNRVYVSGQAVNILFSGKKDNDEEKQDKRGYNRRK